MELIWLGHSCFRFRSREAAIVTDPCPKSTGYSMGRPQADIVTVSSSHPDHSHLAGVTGSPLVVWGPGEYERAGVLITGISTGRDKGQGSKEAKNSAYVIEAENLRICHLGRLSQVPTSEQAEEMSGVDLLLIPVGGDGTLDAAAAAETVSLLEPKLVIPMNYATRAATAKLEAVERFLREMGVPPVEPQPRLSLNRSSLPGETQVSLLNYKR